MVQHLKQLGVKNFLHKPISLKREVFNNAGSTVIGLSLAVDLKSKD